MTKDKKNQKKGKKKRHWLMNSLIVLLVLVGLGLILNKPIRNFIIGLNINRYQVSNYSAKELANNKKKAANFDFSQVKSVDFQSVVGAQMNTQQLPVIGGIAIPDVSINLPIFNGLDSQQLLFGAGTMKPTQQMGQGNYALASHHVFAVTGASQYLFSPLTGAKDGMKIYLTDKDYIYTYTITKVYTVDPNAGYVIDDPAPGSQPEITLVTCTDLEAEGRIIVRGTLDKENGKIPFSKATPAMTAAFDKKYNQWKS